MDIGAVVLHKVIEDGSLEGWARLRLSYFPPAYTSIFTAINKFYTNYSNLPTFAELSLIYERSSTISGAIAALESLEVPDIDLDVAIDALINQYAQNDTVLELGKFVEVLPMLDVEEIKTNLSGIVLQLDEKTLSSEAVFTPSDISIFVSEEETNTDVFPIGLNNSLDAITGGAHREELILIGGKRGSGKSIVCSNLCEAQHRLGNTVAYFTIEMRGHEVFQRGCAIGADIPHSHLRNNKLTREDVEALVKYRARFFTDAEAAVEEFYEHRDRFRFERELRKLPLKDYGQIIIIDDRVLSLTAIDLHLQKLKAKYKDNLTMAVVDYLNQVVYPGASNVAGSMYDWKVQIEISKQLKNLARKHGVVMVSPMQTDQDNGVRFAQGILDSPDIALTLDAHDKSDSAITYDTIKIRNSPNIKATSSINWESLRIDPRDIPTPNGKKKPSQDTGDVNPKVDNIIPRAGKPMDDSPPWET